MHVLVTTRAISRQGIMDLRGVTRTTSQCVMARWQRKRRACRVIEGNGAPIDDVVAVTALIAIASLVHVIPTMASDAVGATEIAKVIGLMAIGAGEPAVSASKGKTGQQKVVEGQRLPRFRRVAIGTLRPIAAFVHVVLAMTGEAGSADLGEHGCLVALAAGHACVHAREREIRRVVIERRLCPVPVDVASFTLIAETTLVRVVGTVTPDARRWRIPVPLVFDVAGTAFEPRMPATKYEVGQRVVEAGFVERRDIQVAAFVVGMAVRTLLGFRSWHEAMESLVLRKVATNGLVTRDTHFKLRLVGQGVMTRLTVVFDIGMR